MMTISQPTPVPLVKYEANNMHPIHRRLPFVHKLYHVVNSGNHICWAQDGLSFYIQDIHTFEQEVIKKSFNNSCMLSFVRQLLIYGFKRTFDGRRTRYRKPTNYASFTHPHFQRDHPNLLNLVKRQKRDKKPVEPTANSIPSIAAPTPTLALHPSSVPTFPLPQQLDRLYNTSPPMYGLHIDTSQPSSTPTPPFSQYEATFTYPTLIGGISQSYFPHSPSIYPQSPQLTTQHFNQVTIPPPPTPLLNSFSNQTSPPPHHPSSHFYYPSEDTMPYYPPHSSHLMSSNHHYSHQYSSN